MCTTPMPGGDAAPGLSSAAIESSPSGRPPRSPGESTAGERQRVVDQICYLYVEQGCSTYDIARRVGLDRQHVNRLLKEAGVPVGPRGRGRSRISSDTGLAALLRALYVEQRLTSEQIGARLGLSGRTVRDRLAKLGIERRSRGACDRTDRDSVAPEELERLYVREGLTADQVAGELGATRRTVLRGAHDHNLPVRPGGAPTAKGDLDVRTIEVLYADPAIRKVLRHFGVPVVTTPGAIWERFPTPVPLKPELVRALYEDCGLAHRHIELLTGNPTLRVARRMREWQIPSRPRGGLSPFLRSWRAEQRARRP